MKLIYVTGPVESPYDNIRSNQVMDISLTCRRILISGHTPIVPILTYNQFRSDPRLASQHHDIAWWINNFFRHHIKLCELFCFVVPRAGEFNKRMELEKEIWRSLGRTEFIPAEAIVKYLLKMPVKYI